MNSYLNETFNLDGKVAVVIGGGGHLCSEMARSFAKVGCKVAILDSRPEKAAAIEEELKQAGYENVISMAIDVAKKQDHVNALEKVLSAFGHVDILVNGAGING